MLHSYVCTQQSAQLCLACGTRICACYGTARGQCPVCYRGLLSNYYRLIPCGYAGCKNHAVAASPRVGFACLSHAIEKGKFNLPDDRRISEYQTDAPLTAYSAQLIDKLSIGGDNYATR